MAVSLNSVDFKFSHNHEYRNTKTPKLQELDLNALFTAY